MQHGEGGMHISGNTRNYITAVNYNSVLSYDEAHELTQQDLLTHF